MVDALVLTADDFGFAAEINEAVEHAHRRGVLSAASLMVTGPAAAHAVALARRLPTLRVGLHLALADVAPASPPECIPALVDTRGRLCCDLPMLAVGITLRSGVRKQLATEIAAQCAAFRRTGLTPDHINAHKHFHLHPVIAGLVLDIGRRYGFTALRVPRESSAAYSVRWLPSQLALAPWLALLEMRARQREYTTPDVVMGRRWSGAMTADRMRLLLEHLPGGIVEIYTHPAVSNSFAGHAAGYRYTDELAALTDPGIREFLQRRKLHLGGYRDAERRARLATAVVPAN